MKADQDQGEQVGEVDLYQRLEDLASELDLVGFGVSRVRRYKNVAVMLRQRSELGYRDSMEFTYRNPDRSTNPATALKDAQSVVSAGFYYGDVNRLDPNEPNEPNSVIARYAQIDSYQVLSNKLTVLARELKDLGHLAQVVLDSNALVDKEAIARAHGGFYLKNSLIAIPRIGSMVVLGNVVTSAHIPSSSKPSRLVGCGSCTICISGCPTGAILPGGVIDARRCISWVLQKPGVIPRSLAGVIGLRVYGCDICQDLCPYNRKVPKQIRSDSQAPQDLISILSLGDTELLATFQHLYIHKRDPNIIRRNALLAMGNLGVLAEPRKQELRALLIQYREAEDPVLASQASDSLDRLGWS